jgi:hypothetical protein
MRLRHGSFRRVEQTIDADLIEGHDDDRRRTDRQPNRVLVGIRSWPDVFLQCIRAAPDHMWPAIASGLAYGPGLNFTEIERICIDESLIALRASASGDRVPASCQ